MGESTQGKRGGCIKRGAVTLFFESDGERQARNIRIDTRLALALFLLCTYVGLSFSLLVGILFFIFFWRGAGGRGDVGQMGERKRSKRECE